MRCFAFEPSDIQMQQDPRLQDLLMFPPGASGTPACQHHAVQPSVAPGNKRGLPHWSAGTGPSPEDDCAGLLLG